MYSENKNFSFTDYDTNLLEVIKQNIEINDGVCMKQCIQIEIFDWKQYDSAQIDDRIEIILAADGIFGFILNI